MVGEPLAVGGSTLAEVLRALRRRALLTQEQLADRAGLSVRTIRNLESGRVGAPHGDTIRLLSDALALGPADRIRLERAREPDADGGRAAAAEAAAPPRQLPSTAADFVGRDLVEREVHRLLVGTASAPAADSPAAPVVLAGGPGVGKTALAVRLGHLAGPEFPGGQLFVDLGGAAARPRDPAEVLGELLRALGCEPSSVPADASARASMYRSSLAGRRVLVVLDDAADERQVRPLLPGSAACPVLLTSRRRLAGLEGSHIVEVGVLDDGSARQLLSNIVGADRLREDDAAAAEIVRCCAGLPLALRICGALLRARPHLRLPELAADLGDEQRRLTTLTFADLAVRASIGLSEAALAPAQRSAFALLATLPVADFDSSTAAAALDVGSAPASDLLGGLVEAHLLDARAHPGGPVRFRFHDLVALYARDLASSPADRAAALVRVLGRWLSLAEQADAALPGTSDIGVRGGAPRHPADPGTVEAVTAAPLAWFAAERHTVAQAVDAAARAGLSEQAWELASGIRTFAALRSEWDLWRRTHEVALQACRDAGDTRGTASMLVGLGKLKIDTHAVSGGAPAELRTAAELFHDLDEPAGEAQALFELASFCELAGDLAGSVEHARRAARLAAAAAADDLAADIDYVWGRALRKQGDHAAARSLLGRALDRYTDRGKTRGRAQANWELAAVHRAIGEPGAAERLLRSCRDDLRGIGDLRGQARVTIDLGLTVWQLGSRDDAERLLLDAVDLCRGIGERSFRAQACDALARLLLELDRPVRAARFAGDAEAIWRDLGDTAHAEQSRQVSRAATAGAAADGAGAR